LPTLPARLIRLLFFSPFRRRAPPLFDVLPAAAFHAFEFTCSSSRLLRDRAGVALPLFSTLPARDVARARKRVTRAHARKRVRANAAAVHLRAAHADSCFFTNGCRSDPESFPNQQNAILPQADRLTRTAQNYGADTRESPYRSQRRYVAHDMSYPSPERENLAATLRHVLFWRDAGDVCLIALKPPDMPPLRSVHAIAAEALPRCPAVADMPFFLKKDARKCGAKSIFADLRARKTALLRGAALRPR